MSKKKKTIGWKKRMAFAMLGILSKNPDSKMSRRELLKAVEEENGGLIPEEKKEKTRTTGRPKWEIHLRFYCQKFVKVGFLRMHKGTWALTREGTEALPQGEDAVIAKADENYTNFRREKKRLKQQENNDSLDANLDIGDDVDTGIRDDVDTGSGDDSDESELFSEKEDVLSDPESDARDEIEEYIQSLDEMVFQDLCAALLRGMGYHVRHVAPPGPDGGIDVIAYKDQLGCEPPRIKLQAKRHATNVQLKVIIDLIGVLTVGDVGIVVSASGFAASCRDAARNNQNNHIELIDITRFVDLWRQHYDNLSEEDKSLLPLQKVYFLNKKGIEKES